MLKIYYLCLKLLQGSCVILILVLMVPCVGILNTDPATFYSLRYLRYFLNPFLNVLIFFMRNVATLKIERAAMDLYLYCKVPYLLQWKARYGIPVYWQEGSGNV